MKKVKVAIFLVLPTDFSYQARKNFGQKNAENLYNALIFFSNFSDFKDENLSSNFS
jgi:hypothetical protein